MWVELEALLKDHPAKIMLWKGEPLRETAEKLKSLGLDSIVFDPCGNAPDIGDFLSVMRESLHRLEQAMTD